MLRAVAFTLGIETTVMKIGHLIGSCNLMQYINYAAELKAVFQGVPSNDAYWKSTLSTPIIGTLEASYVHDDFEIPKPSVKQLQQTINCILMPKSNISLFTVTV